MVSKHGMVPVCVVQTGPIIVYLEVVGFLVDLEMGSDGTVQSILVEV